jgi:hypothetical protein
VEGFSFVTPVTGLNSLNTGKEDDDDDDDLKMVEIHNNRVCLLTYNYLYHKTALRFKTLMW